MNRRRYTPSFAKIPLLDLLWILIAFLICTVITISHFKLPNNYNYQNHDWYLGIQLIELGRIFSREFWINPYTSFMDPQNPGKMLFDGYVFSSGMLIWTPDILIFRFFPIEFCLKLHYIFSVFIAICSLKYVSSKLKLRFVSGLSLCIFWIFSGPIVGRMSEGHIQLTGYMLVPAFLCFLDEIIKIEKRKTGPRISIQLGFFLCLIALLGSTHVFVQFSLIIVVVSLFYRNVRTVGISAILLGVILSAFQFLPAILTPAFKWDTRSIYEGYGWRFWEKFYNTQDYYKFNWKDFNQGVIKYPIEIIHHYFIALSDAKFAIHNEGWEWSLGIGLPATLSLLSINLIYLKNTIKYFSQRKYLFIIFLLSVGVFYRILYLSASKILPLPAIDRIPYRMGIYIFASVMMLSFQNIEKIRDRDNHILWSIYYFLLLMLPTLVTLQSLGWFERLSDDLSFGIQIPGVQVHGDLNNLVYERSIFLGFLISFVSSICSLMYLKKLNIKHKEFI